MDYNWSGGFFMNKIVIVGALALAATVALADPDKKAPTGPKLDKCAVTGEKLGSMGKPIDVAYSGKNAAFKGKIVKICCGGCKGAIAKNPDKYFLAVYGAAKPATRPAAGKKS
jgi:hypothetical protein